MLLFAGTLPGLLILATFASFFSSTTSDPAVSPPETQKLPVTFSLNSYPVNTEILFSVISVDDSLTIPDTDLFDSAQDLNGQFVLFTLGLGWEYLQLSCFQILSLKRQEPAHHPWEKGLAPVSNDNL